eukprot:403342570
MELNANYNLYQNSYIANNTQINNNQLQSWSNSQQQTEYKQSYNKQSNSQNDIDYDMDLESDNKTNEDDLCSSILAKFERLRLDDASTADSEDDVKNREQLLKELVSQEIKHCEDYQMMETQEQKDIRLNEIMQKLLMKYYLNLMLKSEKLNQRYMYNIMRSQNPVLFR